MPDDQTPTTGRRRDRPVTRGDVVAALATWQVLHFIVITVTHFL